MRLCLSAIDNAIEDGGRLLAELGRLRAAVAARIPAEPEILARRGLASQSILIQIKGVSIS
jgi:hypothetical protein